MELKEIDLTKGKDMQHSELKPYPTYYLVKIGSGFYAGYFTWFDVQRRWIFHEWHGVPYQYDTPGTNSSDWKRCWEIIETEEEKAQLSTRELDMINYQKKVEKDLQNLSGDQKDWYEHYLDEGHSHKTALSLAIDSGVDYD